MASVKFEVAKHFKEGTLPWLHEAQREACEALRRKYEADAEKRGKSEAVGTGGAASELEVPPAA